MDLLNLKENQLILIEDKKYEVINKIKYKEKSSYWIEYKIKSIENGKYYYLNVELSFRIILFEVLENENINLELDINFRKEQYELYESGTGKVETYFGMTDMALNEEVKYYEYVNKRDENLVLSVEKHGNKTDISIGKIIDLCNINYERR